MKSSPGKTRLPSSQADAAELSLADAVELCRRQAEFLRGVSHILAQAESEIARLAPVCLAGGACCKFDLTGDRLMVSTGELALLHTQSPPRPHRAAIGRCPYQVGVSCLARDRRPLGCRTFFCRSRSRNFTSDIYERHHTAIRRLHENMVIPYVYVELTRAIMELAAATSV